mmetsp:Transcript_3836/g.10642  ORF Transcript_3836/g.10642 Transcript_3836/m.10642 type:complete len:181 (-) Transcript_3836:345-887(-)
MFLRAVNRCAHSLPIYGGAVHMWTLLPKCAYVVGSLGAVPDAVTPRVVKPLPPVKRTTTFGVTLQQHAKLARALSSAGHGFSWDEADVANVSVSQDPCTIMVRGNSCVNEVGALGAGTEAVTPRVVKALPISRTTAFGVKCQQHAKLARALSSAGHSFFWSAADLAKVSVSHQPSRKIYP